jgi:hypothetical protein
MLAFSSQGPCVVVGSGRSCRRLRALPEVPLDRGCRLCLGWQPCRHLRVVQRGRGFLVCQDCPLVRRDRADLGHQVVHRGRVFRAVRWSCQARRWVPLVRGHQGRQVDRLGRVGRLGHVRHHRHRLRRVPSRRWGPLVRVCQLGQRGLLGSRSMVRGPLAALRAWRLLLGLRRYQRYRQCRPCRLDRVVRLGLELQRRNRSILRRRTTRWCLRLEPRWPVPRWRPMAPGFLPLRILQWVAAVVVAARRIHWLRQPDA